MRPSDEYHRPVTRRYEPTEWEKSIVTVKWINCDPVARHAVEGHEAWQSCADNHGYPTA